MKTFLKISLRPYSGTLFVTRDKDAFSRKYRSLFGSTSVVEKGVEGRCAAGIARNGRWNCVVYAETPWDMSHELAHAVTFLFERCNIPIRSDIDEPFCYMLSQLMKDASPMYGRPATRAKRK